MNEAFRRGDLAGADRLAISLEQQERDVDALIVLGRFVSARGRFGLADRWYRPGLEADACHGGLRCLLGNSRLIRGRFQEALECFERAEVLRPGFVEAAAGRAGALSRLGRGTRAEQIVRDRMRAGDATPGMLGGHRRDPRPHAPLAASLIPRTGTGTGTGTGAGAGRGGGARRRPTRALSPSRARRAGPGPVPRGT